MLFLRNAAILKRGFFVALLLGVLFFLWVNGWFERENSWEIATGFNKIPIPLRPVIDSRLLPINPEQSDGSPDAASPELFWLGHSGFVLQWRDQTLLIDPNLNSMCTASKRKFEAPVTPDQLPYSNAVLISHGHFDHLDTTTLNAIKWAGNSFGDVLIPKGSMDYLESQFISRSNIVAMEEGQEWIQGDLKITAVQARHNGGRFHPLKSRIPALGYIISDGFLSIYYAGDTGFGGHFSKIANKFRPDIAILPIGAYAPRIPLRYFHLNPEEAVQASLILNVTLTVPCHFGTFRLSLDHPASALPQFARKAKEQGLHWQLVPLFKFAG